MYFIKLESFYIITHWYNYSVISSIFLFFIIENSKLDKETVKNGLLLMKIMLIVSFAVILYQYVVDRTFWVNYDDYEMERYLSQKNYLVRLVSVYSWAHNLSWGYFPLIAFGLIYDDNLRRNRIKNNVFWGALIFIYSVLSKARWIMLSFFVVLAVEFKFSKGTRFKKQWWLTIKLVLALLLAVNLLSYWGIDFINIYKFRVLELDKGTGIEGKSASTRLLAFRLFVNNFVDNPFLGTAGVKSQSLLDDLQGNTSQIHVGWLSLLYYFGILGGSLYMFFLYFLFKKIKFISRRTQFQGGFIGMVIFAVSNLTLVNFSFFEMGMITALYFSKYYEQIALTENLYENKPYKK